MPPRPVLIDTDTGVDDALALILALRSPELDVRAITTVAGNVGVGLCTRNVLRILGLVKPARTPPVARGAGRPLFRTLFTAPEVHGTDGLGNSNLPVPRSFRPVKVPAHELIVQECRKFGRQLTIVALGPLTNIARAVRANPAVMRRVGKIISMGGAFRVPGNTGPVAEFNYYVDPEAAAEVLSARIPLVIVPLDVTEQSAVMRREVVARAKANPGKVARAIRSFTRSYMQYHKRTEGFDGGYLHDPLAVAAAIDFSLVRTQRWTVGIETAGKITRGMTVAWHRGSPGKSGSPVDVVLQVDRERFLNLFHERVWI